MPVPLKGEMVSEEAGNSVVEVINCPYFILNRFDLSGPLSCATDGTSFHVLFIVDGAVEIESGGIGMALAKGSSCLIPAGLGDYTINSNATAQVLSVKLQ